jgi:DNA-binding protein H-NS
MKHADLKSMSVDELWSFHELVRSALIKRLSAEKSRLEGRLCELRQNGEPPIRKVGNARRPYPRVFPKFKNPAVPSETWAGRGKQPLWLRAALKAGRSIDEFRIGHAGPATRRAAKKRQ